MNIAKIKIWHKKYFSTVIWVFYFGLMVILNVFVFRLYPNPSDSKSVNNKNKLKVGCINFDPPLSFSSNNKALNKVIAANNGECLSGFEINWAQDLIKTASLKKQYDGITFFSLGFQNLIPALNNKEIDIAIACMSETPERAEKVLPSKAYYFPHYACIVAKNDSRFQDFDETTMKSNKLQELINNHHHQGDSIRFTTVEGTYESQTSLPKIINALNQQNSNCATQIRGTNAVVTVAKMIEDKDADIGILYVHSASHITKLNLQLRAIEIIPQEQDDDLNVAFKQPPFVCYMHKENTELKKQIDKGIENIFYAKIDNYDCGKFQNINDLRYLQDNNVSNEQITSNVANIDRNAIKEKIKEDAQEAYDKISKKYDLYMKQATDDADKSKDKSNFLKKFYSNLFQYRTAFCNALCLALDGFFAGFLLALALVRIKISFQGNKINSYLFYVKKTINKFFDYLFTIIKGVPMPAQALMIYYLIKTPIIKNIVNLDNKWAGLIVLALNSAVNMTGIIWNNIRFFDKGQIEASSALGLTPQQTFKNVIFRSVLQKSNVAIYHQLVVNVQTTAVFSMIGIVDPIFIANRFVSLEFDVLTPFFTVSILYLIIILSVNTYIRKLEQKKGINHAIFN